MHSVMDQRRSAKVMEFTSKIIIITLSFSTLSWSSPALKANQVSYRLPVTIIPVEYHLRINTYLERFDAGDFTFDGVVIITLQIQKDDTKQIVLHTNGLTIDWSSSKLEQVTELAVFADPKGIPIKDPTWDPITHKLTMNVDEALNMRTRYKLTLAYSGNHSDDMHGFYRSSYSENGETRWLLATQFASVHARRAFPCFDEPNFKALYSIYVTIDRALYDNRYYVLTNSKSLNVDMMDARVGFNFEKTPLPISSYLVGFIVSDLKATEVVKFKSGYPDANADQTEKIFQTWGRKSYIDNEMGTLSQLAGPSAIKVLTDRLNIGYGFSKIDHVGLPDISPNAMENWGLITFRERMVLFDGKADSETTRQRDVTVMTHELAHQWFGNLVTLHWWSDIWLNEGFATFLQYHATSEINNKELNATTWNLIGQMVIDELQAAAFETDALENSRPLTSNVEKPEEIDALFDKIPYSKGGSVIRMWMHILGSDIFYDGLNRYLVDRKENVGTPDMLFKAFDDAISKVPQGEKPYLGEAKSTKEAFQPWLDNPGYPVVTVISDGGLHYKLSQERFLARPSPTAEGANAPWHIPISYYTDKEGNAGTTRATHWISASQNDTTITLTTEGASWIVVNTQETGYYRVNYNHSNWDALKKALTNENERNKIHEINRAQIIDDALSLARSTASNYLSYDTALELTTYLVNETEYLPWKAALNGFDILNTKLASDNSSYPLFQKHVLGLLKNQFDALTLTVDPNDSHLTRLLRPLIVDWACKLGHEECIQQALEQFEIDMDPHTTPENRTNPDLKSTVYCTAVRNGNGTTWRVIWDLFAKSIDSYQQTLLLSVLGCSESEDDLNLFLEKTINGEIRRQDSFLAFTSVYSGNPQNVNVALKFLAKHLLTIQKYYGGLNPLGDLLVGIASKLETNADLDIMNAILTAINWNPELAPALAKAQDAIEIVKTNQKWLNSKKGGISLWLKRNYGDNPGNGGGDGDGGHDGGDGDGDGGHNGGDGGGHDGGDGGGHDGGDGSGDGGDNGNGGDGGGGGGGNGGDGGGDGGNETGGGGTTHITTSTFAVLLCIIINRFA